MKDSLFDDLPLFAGVDETQPKFNTAVTVKLTPENLVFIDNPNEVRPELGYDVLYESQIRELRAIETEGNAGRKKWIMVAMPEHPPNGLPNECWFLFETYHKMDVDWHLKNGLYKNGKETT